MKQLLVNITSLSHQSPGPVVSPRLVDAVSRDVEWLHATLEPAAKADPFTGRLLQMSKDIHREAGKLGMKHRSSDEVDEGHQVDEVMVRVDG